LREFGRFIRFPEASDRDVAALESELSEVFAREDIGAILVEPMQARGGIRIPPEWFLPLVRRVSEAHGALRVLDEIYTGFGRTGAWFACEHSGVVPDLVCLGKALTGGFPLSACVGRVAVMDAWPPSDGEAIHTSTFLGHPVGCAMALAQIGELRSRRLPQRALALGKVLERELLRIQSAFPQAIRRVAVRGLMAGIELQTVEGLPATALSLGIVKAMLHRGFLVLPEGAQAEVVGFTPPLTLAEPDLLRSVRALEAVLEERLSPDANGRKTRTRKRSKT
jgi:4-aminobutyrate aminotransferase/(S)-3-amino-2-methylpropionate transaminase